MYWLVEMFEVVTKSDLRPTITCLGVIIDSELNFKAHLKMVTKKAFYHLRNIAKVRPFLSQNDAEKLVHAFISSRLDYWIIVMPFSLVFL